MCFCGVGLFSRMKSTAAVLAASRKRIGAGTRTEPENRHKTPPVMTVTLAKGMNLVITRVFVLTVAPPRSSPERNDAVGSNALKAFLGTIRPFYQHRLDFNLIAQPEMHARIIAAEVTGIGMRTAPQGILAAPDNRDTRTDAEPVQLRRFQLHGKPMAALTRLVVKQADRPVVIGDYDVDRAVVIEITEGSSAADFLD